MVSDQKKLSHTVRDDARSLHEYIKTGLSKKLFWAKIFDFWVVGDTVMPSDNQSVQWSFESDNDFFTKSNLTSSMYLWVLFRFKVY